jgi:SagB-type dehydrogenase family enzyme
MPAPPPHGQAVLDYHERTKHHWHRFARSAGYMDWDNQPAPFRTYAGAPEIPLALMAEDPPMAYDALYRPGAGDAAAFDLAAVGGLLEMSLGLSAWKAAAAQRWALRMNPSSGNLHPTEAHLVATGIADLPDGLYHYHPLNHSLEERGLLAPRQVRALTPHIGSPCLMVALSSIFWREAWKYGERAYRYCQHDIGHALAALRFAARLNRWRLVRLLAADNDIAAVLGFDRTPWPPQEAEEPALIAAILPAAETPSSGVLPAEALRILRAVDLKGRPSRLSPRHQAWEIIAQTAAACRQPRTTAAAPLVGDAPPVFTPAVKPETKPAAALIRRRRSAQAFDPRPALDREAFLGMLDRTRPRPAAPPFDVDIGPARISLALFVHRIRDVAPGLYAFVRHPDHLEDLRRAAAGTFAWQAPVDGFPLYLLEPGDVRAEAIDLACRQEIAGFSAFSLGMLARFATEVRDTPWVYRHLFWEAGLIGQILYLEAEARGVRGTGIGCYFDDPVHERLGLRDRTWQSLYHFTVGFPVEDARLQTLPPYSHLDPRRRPSRS